MNEPAAKPVIKKRGLRRRHVLVGVGAAAGGLAITKALGLYNLSDQAAGARRVVARLDAPHADPVRRAHDLFLARTFHKRLPQGQPPDPIHLLAEPDLAPDVAREFSRDALPGHDRSRDAPLSRPRD